MNTTFKYRAFISYSHSDESWARGCIAASKPIAYPVTWSARNRIRSGASALRARVPRSRRAGYGDEPGRDADASTGAIGLPDRGLLAGGRAIALGQRGDPGVQAPRPRAAHLLPARERRARRFGGSGTAERGVLSAGADLRIGGDGELTEEPSEPIAADARPHKDGKQDALLKLLAGMLDVGLDELKQREAHRRQRRLMALVAASIAGMMITSGLAAPPGSRATRRSANATRAEAEAETAKQTTRFMVDLFKVSDPSEALGNTHHGARDSRQGCRAHRHRTRRTAGHPGDVDGYDGHGLHEPRALRPRDSAHARSAGKAPGLPERNGCGHRREPEPSRQGAVAQGGLPGGGAALREALAMQRKVLGEDSAEVATTLSALADVMSFTGEYDKGEPLIEEALRIRRNAIRRSTSRRRREPR